MIGSRGLPGRILEFSEPTEKQEEAAETAFV
jgi:hypothetical protein